MLSRRHRIPKKSTQSTPPPDPTPTTVITGMYGGWGQGGADVISQFETTHGVTIKYGHEFGDRSQWSWFDSGTEFDVWSAWVSAKAGRRFTYSCPLISDDTGISSAAQRYAALAAGNFDSHFTMLGQAFQSYPSLRNAIIRLGWEFNGMNWPWSVPPDDATTLQNYKTGFNRAAAAIKSKCPTVEIEWCPNCQLDYTQRTFSDMYPGDQHVDYIGIGMYAYYWPDDTTDIETKWSWLKDSTNGLADQVALARQRNKKLAHTEWGLWQTNTAGGWGDSPEFIRRLTAWHRDNGYSYQVYNNIDTDGNTHLLSAYPNAFAEYVKILKA